MKRKRKTWKQTFFVLCCTAGIFYFGYRVLFVSTKTSVISPVPTNEKASLSTPLLTRTKNPETLRNIIREAIGDTWKNYSLYVKDFTSDFILGVNEEVMYPGASINKIPILSVLYFLAQQGEVNLDEVITLQKEDIQDYGTGSMRYTAPGTTYTVKTLAKLMMQQSDNTAAYILAQHIMSLEKIQNTLTGWGLVQTDMEKNTTSNKDVELLMEKIFREHIVNHAMTLEMLSFFKDGDIEDRLPRSLPKDVTVYHKTGNAVGYVHDAGIIVGPKARYYIGILTSDVTDEQRTIDLMATISQKVYDFMK